MRIRSTVTICVLAATALFSISGLDTLHARPGVTSSGLRPPASAQNQSLELPAPKAQSAQSSPPVAQASAAPEPEPIEPKPTARPPNVEAGERLDVMCFGGGSANKLDTVSGHSTGSFSGSFSTLNGTYGSFDGSSSSWATVYVPRSQDFVDQVSLFIEGDEGRLRMPRTMLPLIRGGQDGWFKLKDIKIKANEITASVAVNLINNPKLRLDRYSGAISISGKAGDYVGQCRLIRIDQMQRQF